MKAFLSFIRVTMMPLTMAVPVLGYWSSLEGLGDNYNLLWLALIGASAHIFGFGLNDIVDLSIDKHAEYRNDSPLVNGKLSLTMAWIIVLLQIPIMFILYNCNGDTENKVLGNVFILLSIILSCVYNFFSKKGMVKRWLAELSLAISISFLCLAGAYLYHFEITLGNILFCTSFGLVLLSINSLGSGLKDLKTDLEAGGKSFVIENGARMIGQDQIFISNKLKIYGMTVQILMLINFIIYLWSVDSISLINISFLSFSIFGLFYLHHLLAQKTFTGIHQKGPLLYGYLNLISLIFLEFKVLPLVLTIIFLLFGMQLIFLYFRYKYFSKP